VQLRPAEIRYRIALGDAYAFPVLIRMQQDRDSAELKPMDLARVRQIYIQAAERAPKSPLPHLRLANLYWEEDPVVAAAHLEKAMALDPENALPVYMRALLRFQANEDDLGRKCLMAARACRLIRYPLIAATGTLNLAQTGNYMVGQNVVRIPYSYNLRQLARQIVRVADTRKDAKPGSADDARPLLVEGERLASRVIRAEPRTLDSALSGVTMDAAIEKPLQSLLEARKDGPGLNALQERRESVKAIREALSAAVASLQAGITAGRIAPPWQDESEPVNKALAGSRLEETIDSSGDPLPDTNP
jgi:hypothetical protein